MKKYGALWVVIMTLAVAVACWAAFEVEIQVAPNVLVLGDSGQWVTVHAGIPFSQVDLGSVALNDIPAAAVKADLRGNLVAKFRQKDVEPIVEPPCADLELTGLTRDGEKFFGTATIRVK